MNRDDAASTTAAQDAFGMSQADLAALGAPNMVYIRKVTAEEVLPDISDSEDAQTLKALPSDAELYAVHAADGERLALLSDRDAAFVTARQHEMEPVSVH